MCLPPGSIVFLNKRLLWYLFTFIQNKLIFFSITNLSLWTKIVWFQILIVWLNNANLSGKKWSRDIFWHRNLFSRILRSWKFILLNVFFSFSFQQSRLSLICNLNSKGNLKRKHLNLELFPEGGSSFYLFKFKLRYLRPYMRFCKTFFSFQLPFIRSFRKKQKFGRFKNLKFT